MSSIIVAITPVTGHVVPLLTIAGSLVEQGHDVTVLTGSAFHRQSAATGAKVVHLAGEADIDGGAGRTELVCPRTFQSYDSGSGGTGATLERKPACRNHLGPVTYP
jgi:UDP:flavonoid glycosyltransferase YjiC (YdhE family)